MSKAEKKETGPPHVLALSGALTLDRISELKQVFMEALKHHPIIEIQVEKVGAVDFSFLQLLCAAEKKRHPAKKNA